MASTSVYLNENFTELTEAIKNFVSDERIDEEIRKEYLEKINNILQNSKENGFVK
jgi:hypothetical protein